MKSTFPRLAHILLILLICLLVDQITVIGNVICVSKHQDFQISVLKLNKFE